MRRSLAELGFTAPLADLPAHKAEVFHALQGQVEALKRSELEKAQIKAKGKARGNG